MVQEFQVLRCFRCRTFQVQQVKKVNKWSCKLCGEKQSLLKEFGRGSGADCRRHVQKLNAMRGAMVEEQDRRAQSLWEEGDEEKLTQVNQSRGSRWSKYLDTPDEEAVPEEEESEGSVSLERHERYRRMNRKRKRSEEQRGGRQVDTTEQGVNRREDAVLNAIEEETSMVSFSKPNCLTLQRPSSTPRTPTTKTTMTTSRSTPSPSRTSNSPTVSCGPASRWARFLIPDSQVTEEVEPSCGPKSRTTLSPTRTSSPPSRTVNPSTETRCLESRWARFVTPVTEGVELPPCGWSQTTCGGADIIKPQPMLPVSSMFDSGEDFNFDDFLT
ncbi:MRN complex-interacting protein [Pholidichthys leucotaenia]